MKDVDREEAVSIVLFLIGIGLVVGGIFAINVALGCIVLGLALVWLVITQ